MVYILGGTPLVLGKETYSLDYEMDSATGHTNVVWQDSSGRTVDITRKLEGGKIAGWVDVRDNKIGSYIDSMNDLTEELVWQVNSLHAQGVGLESVSSMTSSVEVSGLAYDLSTDFLFSGRFTAGGSFDIVVYNDTTGQSTRSTVTLGGGATVGDLITAVGAAGNMNAQIDADNHVQLYSDAGYSFVINPDETDDSNNALAILGMNTFFTWNEEVGQIVPDLTETLDINAVLEANSSLISAAYLDENNNIAPGGNDVALAVYSLQDQVISDFAGTGTNTTIDTFYSSFIAGVGVDVQNAGLNEKYNDTLLTQYVQKKESVVGINLDEEMADILKFQHLYQAAAKLISIADEMMQALLSVK